MSMMKCPECGKEISSKAKFCPQCNYSVSFFRRYLNNKKIIVLCILGVAIVVSIVFYINHINQPSSKLMKAIRNNEFITAQTIFDESVKKYDKQLEMFFEGLSVYLPKLESDYAKGKIDYNKVADVINFIENNISEMPVIKIKDDLSTIFQSKSDYDTAESYKHNNDFLNAIKYFEQVSEKDLEFYSESRKQIDECKSLYIEQICNEINKAISGDDVENDCIKISDKIKAQPWLQDNTEVLNAYEKLKLKVSEQICNEINNAISGDNLKDMYILITSKVKIHPWLSDNTQVSNALNDLNSKVKDNIIQPIINQIDEYMKKKNYTDSIGLLYENMKYDVDNMLSNKLNEVKQRRIND